MAHSLLVSLWCNRGLGKGTEYSAAKSSSLSKEIYQAAIFDSRVAKILAP